MSMCLRLLLALAAAALPQHAVATQPDSVQCANDAVARMGVPPIVVAGIMQVEGGKLGMESPNSNGSFDLGPMQINTIHLKEFANYGISRAMLRDDLCVNVAAAAFMLRRHYQTTGDWATAITRYHSKTPVHAARYAGLVARAFKRIAAESVASN